LNGNTYTLYTHLDAFDPSLLAVGGQVLAGDPIGVEGNSMDAVEHNAAFDASLDADDGGDTNATEYRDGTKPRGLSAGVQGAILTTCRYRYSRDIACTAN
jgi:hypothetical protein